MTRNEIVQVNRYYLILISIIFLVDTNDQTYVILCEF